MDTQTFEFIMAAAEQSLGSVFRADPSRGNRERLLNLLDLLAGIRLSTGQIPEALAASRRLRDIVRAAPADDPDRLLLARYGAIAEYRLSKHGAADGDWREVVRLFVLAQQNGPLADPDQAMLAEARTAAAAGTPEAVP